MSYQNETDCRNCGDTPCSCPWVPKALTLADRFASIADELYVERVNQDAKWGEQNHPDGTGVHEGQIEAAIVDRKVCQDAFAAGEGTYCDILREEVSEAFAESDPAKLRAELVQVAAVAVAWIEKIDRDLARAAVSR